MSGLSFLVRFPPPLIRDIEARRRRKSVHFIVSENGSDEISELNWNLINSYDLLAKIGDKRASTMVFSTASYRTIPTGWVYRLVRGRARAGSPRLLLSIRLFLDVPHLVGFDQQHLVDYTIPVIPRAGFIQVHSIIKPYDIRVRNRWMIQDRSNHKNARSIPDR